MSAGLILPDAVSSHASVLILGVAEAASHAFCMISSASRAPLAKRKRREEAETNWL